MKLRLIEQALLEDSNKWTDANLKSLKTFIDQNCQPYLSQLSSPNEKLYRGTKTRLSGNLAAAEIPVRSDRKSTHSAPRVTDFFNQAIADAGLVANRNNAIFTTGDIGFARSYGSVYVVIPVGEFNYTWSLTARDWYIKLGVDFSELELAIDDLPFVPQKYKSVDFINTNFMHAVHNAKKETDYIRDVYNLLLNSLPKFEKMSDEEKKAWGSKANQHVSSLIAKSMELQGDNGTLSQAIESGHEVMLTAASVLYVDETYYDLIFGIR